jgi:hypothetical protein
LCHCSMDVLLTPRIDLLTPQANFLKVAARRG